MQALLKSTSKAHPVLLHTQTPLGGGFQAHLNGAEMQRWLGKSPGKTQEGVARRLLPEYKWAAARSERVQTTRFTKAGAVIAHPAAWPQRCLWKERVECTSTTKKMRQRS